MILTHLYSHTIVGKAIRIVSSIIFKLGSLEFLKTSEFQLTTV
jgi:hypothetical protein